MAIFILTHDGEDLINWCIQGKVPEQGSPVIGHVAKGIPSGGHMGMLPRGGHMGMLPRGGQSECRELSL